MENSIIRHPNLRLPVALLFVIHFIVIRHRQTLLLEIVLSVMMHYNVEILKKRHEKVHFWHFYFPKF